jgi:PAS domain S-box-containing protein
MRITRISLPAILALAFAAIFLATMATGLQITRLYEMLFYSAETVQTQKLLDIEAATKLWNGQLALGAAAARGIAGDPALLQAAALGDVDRARDLLGDELDRRAAPNAAVAVEGLTLYDARLHPVAERWRSAPATVPSELLAGVAERGISPRLGAAEFAWLDHGQPRLTVVVPAGSDAARYLGLHLDPLPAFGEIDQRIGTMVKILSRTDHRLLYEAGRVRAAPDTITRQSTLRLTGPRGEYLADVEVTDDVSDLSGALDQTRRNWMAIYAVIVGGVAAAALIAVHSFLKQVRRREQEDEQRFRDYAETASDWFWETDPDHRFSYMSDRARTYGIDPETRIGLSRLDIAGDAAETPEKWRAHLTALERHEPFRDFVYRRVVSDGVVRDVTVSGKPVFDANGRFRGYRGTARDVTAQLAAERQLRAAKAEAESLRDDALSADRAKSEFLATMSHELRTPLNAIIGFSEAMMHEVMGPIGSARYREYACDIHNSGQHLLELINSILDLSKLQARSMSLNEEVIDLGSVAAACVRLVRERASKSQVELRAALPPHLLLVRADELRLKQVLLNLLSNAVKFTPEGGTVAISALQDARGTEIVVADTGIGLTEEEIGLALQPFRQIDNSLGRRHQGTGLGLPLSKALVELHGGELRIDSSPGRGTRVTMVLPAERTVSGDKALRIAG